MTSSVYDLLQETLRTGGVESVLEQLADTLRHQRKLHELFDARLMLARWRLGLPLTQPTNFDALEPADRDRMEQAYLEACREVGYLLLDEGRLREAWMYLRLVGDNEEVARRIRQLEVTEENVEDLIQLSLHEGVSPAYGFELILKHYGTCNAVTMYQQEMHTKPLAAQREVASLLVRHLHGELTQNVRADIHRREGSEPTGSTLQQLVQDRDWLFSNDNYHIDTSHLNAVVRFSLVLEEPADLRLALDLTHYGRHLSPQFQFQGEDPFSDTYVDHGRFLGALLGQDVDEALAHFRQQAEQTNLEEDGTTCVEVYLALLARLGRYREAMEEHARLLPPGTRTLGYSPGLLELSASGNQWETLMRLARQRDDLVGYVAGLLQQNAAGAAAGTAAR